MAPTTLLLSHLLFQSSRSLIRTCSVLKDFCYAEINAEKWGPLLLIIKSYTIFLNIFEKVFKTLTGRKLFSDYLSSVRLSKGEMYATLALSWNIPLLKQWLIAIANG